MVEDPGPIPGVDCCDDDDVERLLGPPALISTAFEPFSTVMQPSFSVPRHCCRHRHHRPPKAPPPPPQSQPHVPAAPEPHVSADAAAADVADAVAVVVPPHPPESETPSAKTH